MVTLSPRASSIAAKEAQRGYAPAGHKNIIRFHAEPESLGVFG